jgi:hypothetical protein
MEYVLGPWKNETMDALVYAKADEVRTRRAKGKLELLRDCAGTCYAAKSCRTLAASWPGWKRVPRASMPVTWSPTSPVVAGSGYRQPLLRARSGGERDQAAQGETAVRRHQLPLAFGQPAGLIPHTAAYWLMREVRDAIPRPRTLASGEFSIIRRRLLKVAVRIKETATRISLAFASNCPDAALFRGLVGTLVLRPT